MANKKLGPEKAKALQEEIKNGESPTALAKKYNISELAIQYHKQQLRKQGVELPDQRKAVKPVISKANTVKSTKNMGSTNIGKNTHVVINGIGITFHNKKADVDIFDNKIEIKY